jgi:galactokinase
MSDTAVWSAPGRVNLIGEHTDYNDGFALPFAIQLGCTASAIISVSPQLEISSAQQTGVVRLEVDDLEGRDMGWAAYVAGVLHSMQQLGISVPGMRIHVDSSVPQGAGLSSSAALTVSVACAVNDAIGAGLSHDQLLTITCRAENDYVGAPTGGMDQLASLYGQRGAVLLCDMRSKVHRRVRFELADEQLTLLVVDTHTPHRHVDGGYRSRREGCARAAHLLGVRTLREINMEDLDEAKRRLPDTTLRGYAKHVVTENQRVLETVTLLEGRQTTEIGALLVASHESLRDDFKVSTPELDLAVRVLLDAGAFGARLVGGGFGGSVVSLISISAIEPARALLNASFVNAGFASPTSIELLPSEGATRIS